MGGCIQLKNTVAATSVCSRSRQFNWVVTLFSLMFFSLFSSFSLADNATKPYCDFPLQKTATVGQMIKPYPVVVLDLTSQDDNVSWIEALSACGDETLYVMILGDYNNENTDCDEAFSSCLFDLNEVQLLGEGEDNNPAARNWYEVHLSINVNDSGNWAEKIDECPRSSEITASGFYRISYLGGDAQAGAYSTRRVQVIDPVRAEATWGLVGDSCFNFSEFTFPTLLED